MTTAAICATQEVSWSPSYYRGEQYDSDLGLYYLRARYYNPATGRFLSRDPVAGKAKDPKTLHKYLYAGGDPVNAIDPTGRQLWEGFAILAEDVKKAIIVQGVGICVSALLGASAGLIFASAPTTFVAGGNTALCLLMLQSGWAAGLLLF